ncbi:MAG: hypothetical protein H0V30_10240 [Chitinophagaceae bacterium]|jgi:hypothetical protein|nr:hypothetical protein [Chitinophagaceae bacterium]
MILDGITGQSQPIFALDYKWIKVIHFVLLLAQSIHPFTSSACLACLAALLREENLQYNLLNWKTGKDEFAKRHTEETIIIHISQTKPQSTTKHPR